MHLPINGMVGPRLEENGLYSRAASQEHEGELGSDTR